jgi:hypothetical protein
VKNSTLPVESIAAWMAVIGKGTLVASHWPTSAGSPTAAASAAAAAAGRAGAASSPALDCLLRIARRIDACSAACSAPSVIVSIARSSRSLLPATPRLPR